MYCHSCSGAFTAIYPSPLFTRSAAAAEAVRLMKQSAEGITGAGEQKALSPLDAAWTGSNGAYQALLRLQSRNTRIAQLQGQQGQQGSEDAAHGGLPL
jgi:hypothetical protein